MVDGARCCPAARAPSAVHASPATSPRPSRPPDATAPHPRPAPCEPHPQDQPAATSPPPVKIQPFSRADLAPSGITLANHLIRQPCREPSKARKSAILTKRPATSRPSNTIPEG